MAVIRAVARFSLMIFFVWASFVVKHALAQRAEKSLYVRSPTYDQYTKANPAAPQRKDAYALFYKPVSIYTCSF
jgi:hypothetical protein